jgi:ParB-like chromosome segregation protein Spo0J
MKEMTEIKRVEIQHLKLLEDNPRTITKESLESLCASIKSDPEMLWRRPVLVNDVEGSLTVYAGNQRVIAAKWIGWTTIPCIIDKDLPKEIIKRRVLIDNRHSGEWDYDILANTFSMDDLFDAGFTPEELELDMSQPTEPSEEKDCSKCEMCGKKLTKRKS